MIRPCGPVPVTVERSTPSSCASRRTSGVARTADAWLGFGFDEDLDTAAEQAIGVLLDVMEQQLGYDRTHALALSSVAVDLHVTQIVNGAKGVHAVLRDDALGR